MRPSQKSADPTGTLKTSAEVNPTGVAHRRSVRYVAFLNHSHAVIKVTRFRRDNPRVRKTTGSVFHPFAQTGFGIVDKFRAQVVRRGRGTIAVSAVIIVIPIVQSVLIVVTVAPHSALAEHHVSVVI